MALDHAVLYPLGSAVATILLASLSVVVLKARPRDASNRAFAAFTALVALNYALTTAWAIGRGIHSNSGAPYPSYLDLLMLAAMMVQVWDPVALLWFVGVYPQPNALRSRRARVAIVALALLAEAIIVTSPETLSGRVIETSSWRIRFLESYLTLSYVLAFLAFLAVEIRRPVDAPPALPRGFLLGWAVVAIYRFGLSLDLGILRTLIGTYGPHAEFISLMTISTVQSIGLATLVVLGAAPFARGGRRKEITRLLARASLVMLGISAVVVAPTVIHLLTGSGLTFGLVLGALNSVLANSAFAARWIVFTLLVGPALLSNQFFDIEASLRRALVATVVGGTLIVLFVGSAILLDSGLTNEGTLPAKTVIILVMIALASTQSMHFGRYVANRLIPPERERSESYRRLRRFEVYREAARAVATGRAPAADLETLREKLGLTPSEARLAATAAAPRAPTPPVKPGLVLNRRYEVKRAIGRGSHGRVFLARDQRTSRDVALKEVDSGSRDGARLAQRIEQEVLAAGRLSHPNLLVASDYFVEGTSAFVVMEYMPGGSLADRIARDGALSPHESGRIALEVLDGLAAAHAAGVLHRDVKPANVLFGADGRARLSDFGVALVAEAGHTATSLLDPRVPGTLAYMPPEALAGVAPGTRSDVYATGTLLFEALAGRLPHPGEATPPGCPRALAEVVTRARETDPGERYPTVEAMRLALAEALAETPHSPPAGAGPPARREPGGPSR